MSSRIIGWLSAGLLGIVACSSTPGTTEAGHSSAASSGGVTAGSGGNSASTGGTGGGGGSAPTDGTPTRLACTGKFGSALTATHGRLDGYLVAIVPPGSGKGCHSDSTHVHLQVQVKGEIYDVAVNMDVLDAELEAPLPGGPWSEGWHPGEALDYPTSLGVHAEAFSTTTQPALAQKLEAELAAVNHITVFATGYGPTGAHDVHRKGSGDDGAIVFNPLSAKAHLLLFRFTTNSF